jgi:hypothetical protein
MRILIFLMALGVLCCTTTKKTTETKQPHLRAAAPHVPLLIYKTRNDYSQNVPIILSENKQIIEQYPAPKDLKKGDVLALPDALPNGYWLDNRGVNARVAFLKYTYAEYAALNNAPTLEELLAAILDANPIVELYSCGNRLRMDNPLAEAKRIVLEGFKNCERLK